MSVLRRIFLIWRLFAVLKQRGNLVRHVMTVLVVCTADCGQYLSLTWTQPGMPKSVPNVNSVLIYNGLLTNVVVLAAVAGPYQLELLEIGTCPEREVGRVGDDVTIHGNFYHNRSMGPRAVFTGIGILKNNNTVRGSTSVTIDAAKWDPVSGWREHFMVMSLGEICLLMEGVASDVTKTISEVVSENFPRKCPVPDGVYHVENAFVNLGQFNHFPALPYGRFRGHILGYHLRKPSVKTPRMCVRFVIHVHPRVKKRGD